MLPFVEVPVIQVGSFTFQLFGLLVATGCIVGWLVSRREAKRRGLSPSIIDECVVWALLPGFLTSRVFDLLFYSPGELVAAPWAFLLVWKSMSSIGGFVGGSVGALTFLHRSKLPILRYCDCLLLGLIVGMFFGRLGCALVHDHPGIRTTFVLAVKYPDGPRYDLGLYEWLFISLLLVCTLSIDRARLPSGLLLGTVCTLYAVVRFALDFLRVGELRYDGLSASQYGCVAMLLIGIVLCFFALKSSQGRRGIEDENTPFV